MRPVPVVNLFRATPWSPKTKTFLRKLLQNTVRAKNNGPTNLSKPFSPRTESTVMIGLIAHLSNGNSLTISGWWSNFVIIQSASERKNTGETPSFKRGSKWWVRTWTLKARLFTSVSGNCSRFGVRLHSSLSPYKTSANFTLFNKL